MELDGVTGRWGAGDAVKQFEIWCAAEWGCFAVGVEQQFDTADAAIEGLGEKHVGAELSVVACGPACEAGEECGCSRPFCYGACVFAVGFACVADGASAACLPECDYGGFVFIGGDGGECGFGADIAEVVSTNGRC